jgi:hypothetical protein
MRFWGNNAPDEEAGRGAESGPVSEMLVEAAAGIREVVDAADRAVAKMRNYDEVAGEGDARINRERLVQELVRSVLERTEDLRTEAGEVAQILDRAGSKLQATAQAPHVHVHDEAGPALDVDAGPARFTGRAEGSRPAPTSTHGNAAGPPAEGVRLLATQMAVAGSDRAEVEHRLAREFGVRDADYLLDELFSREGAAGAG